MTLRERQSRFARLQGRLIDYAVNVMRAELTLGEAWRSDEQAELNALSRAARARIAELLRAEFPSLAAAIARSTGVGIRQSVHRDRLALDWNLFVDGQYQTSAAVYEPLGRFWEGLDPLCRWGGRFSDAPHFSFEDGGRQ